MALALRRGNQSIALSLLAATALASWPAFSQSFTIQSGETKVVPQVMHNAGDVGTVKAGGTVNMTDPGEAAVEMLNDDQKLTNDGTLTASGSGSYGIASGGDGTVIVNNGLVHVDNGALAGILAVGSDTRITNAGTVEIGGTNAFGIFVGGENSSVANSGTIRTVGDGTLGVLAVGDYDRIDNTGIIDVNGNGGDGIVVDASGVTVSNDGSIRTSGIATFGVVANGNSNTIVNNGRIDSEGATSGGIVAGGEGVTISNSGAITVSGGVIGIGVGTGFSLGLGDNAAIFNSGSVIVSGDNSVSIAAGGNNSVITNSGTILNNGGVAAILFGGDDARLNLLGGTAIQGEIIFGGSDNTVSFGRGLNAVMTFSGNFPDVIMTGGRPYVVRDDTVAVLDPAGFRGAHAVVTDLTGNIAGAIEDRLALARNTGFGELSLRGPIVADGVVEPAAPLGPVFWATAIGSYRSESHSGDDEGFRNSLGGGIAGFDAEVSDLWRAGAFLGGAGGSVHVDDSGHNRSYSSFFGGGYLGYAAGLNFADLSLSVGSLRQNADRRIANNMVLGGIETGRANVNGVFVSPAVTFGTHVAMGDTIIVPSLRLRYAGLFLDSYSEEGAHDELSVDSRHVNVFEARGQIALPLAPQVTDNGVWAASLRAGIDGIAQNGGRVSATMLGEDISFTPDDRKGVVRGFAGADFTFLNDSQMQLQGTIELGYGSDRAFTAVARAGLSIPF